MGINCTCTVNYFIDRIFTFYINNDNNNTLLAALSALFALAGMRACVEFHAPGGVRFAVDFAPNMVTKRFALAACQIRVCVIFHPMGDARTKPGAVLFKKAEP